MSIHFFSAYLSDSAKDEIIYVLVFAYRTRTMQWFSTTVWASRRHVITTLILYGNYGSPDNLFANSSISWWHRLRKTALRHTLTPSQINRPSINRNQCCLTFGVLMSSLLTRSYETAVFAFEKNACCINYEMQFRSICYEQHVLEHMKHVCSFHYI